MTDRAPPELRVPVPLSPDNFTPLSRTPWGGDVIGRRFKRSVVPDAVGRCIGEAWEFSIDPAFPSRVALGVYAGATLAELVAAHPRAILSPALAERQASCEILVKLLDTAAPLSLQVHPADGDPDLAADECGKPEAWLVLAAAPGASIYVGFRRPLSRAALGLALAAGVGVEELLRREPVAPGDYFEIAPGVAHAVGAGVTLLEPQRVLPGRAGKTYRLWDWGRRYDAQGRPADAHGALRPLHVAAGLKLVDPERQGQDGFAATLRRSPVVRAALGAVVREFPANAHYRVLTATCAPGATVRLDIVGGYGALTMLAGDLRWADGRSGAALPAGQTALLPHAAMPLTLTAGEAGAEFALVVPAAARAEAGGA